MIKYLKNLEYLIPLLTNVSGWIKVLFLLWVMLTVFLSIVITKAAFDKNKRKALKEERYKTAMAKIEVNRHLNDYQIKIDAVLDNALRESSQIAAKYSVNGSLQSDPHIKAQIAHAVNTKKDIEKAFTDMNKEIEDILFGNFGTILLSELDSFSQEFKIFSDKKNGLKELYKRLEDNVKSWEKKALGTSNITKDLHL